MVPSWRCHGTDILYLEHLDVSRTVPGCSSWVPAYCLALVFTANIAISRRVVGSRIRHTDTKTSSGDRRKRSFVVIWHDASVLCGGSLVRRYRWPRSCLYDELRLALSVLGRDASVVHGRAICGRAGRRVTGGRLKLGGACFFRGFGGTSGKDRFELPCLCRLSTASRQVCRCGDYDG